MRRFESTDTLGTISTEDVVLYAVFVMPLIVANVIAHFLLSSTSGPSLDLFSVEPTVAKLSTFSFAAWPESAPCARRC